MVKKEKGSVALIVSYTVVFILIVLSASLALVSLKRKSQLQETKILQNVYDGDMDKIYDEQILKRDLSSNS